MSQMSFDTKLIIIKVDKQDMNFSECVYPELELLNQKIKSSLSNIINRICTFTKKEAVFIEESEKCLLCSENISFHNIHDLIRIYSLILVCLKTHCSQILEINIEDLFVLEMFLLNFIKTQEPSKVKFLIKYNNNVNDHMYKYALKDQLLSIYKTYFYEKKFNINCEQEIESLTFLYYKLVDLKCKNTMSKDYLLIILFFRREYHRFMKVYSTIKKSHFVIRLAILFELLEDNDDEINNHLNILRITDDINVKNSTLQSFLLLLEDTHNFDFSEVLKLFEEVRDENQWLKNLKNGVDWQNCVRLWAKNRNDESAYVDNSMIDICIKYSKFEDGWLIFDNTECIETSKYNRGINLCCSAYKKSKHCLWKKRLSNIINSIFENLEILNLDNLLENLFINIKNLPTSQIIRVTNKIQTYLIKLKLKESTIEILFGFYNMFCYEYKNQDLNRVCCTNAIYIYNKWCKSRMSNFNIFKTSKTEFDSKIYSHMLGLCDISENCEFFNKVCKDLVKNNTHLNRELCRRLESFHSKNCNNCSCKTKQIVNANDGQNILAHFFK